MFRKVGMAALILSAALHAEEEFIPFYVAESQTAPEQEGVKVPVEVDGKVKLEVIPADEPFLTGPLLCPSGHTIPFGHINLEPYVFINNNLGYYNNHWHIHRFSGPSADSINLQYLVQVGVSSFQDFSFIPQVFYNYTGSRNNVRYGDFVVQTGFQIYTSRFDSWIPTTKLEFSEVLPTGKYDQLDMDLIGTDMGGSGSFATSIKLVMTDLWYFGGHHFLAARMSNGVTFFTDVDVVGINAYGGDSTTSGTVKPGTAFTTIGGLEFTLTKNWALAFDIDFTYSMPTKFKGTSIATVGNNNHVFLLSLAPALEYNFNANMGLIGGVWFSVLGENTNEFINGVIAFNWFFP